MSNKKKNILSLTEMPHLEINKHSPLGASFGFVDFRMERYNLSQEEKYGLMASVHGDGVVAKTGDGEWLFFSDSKGVLGATEEQIRTLPHLPENWQEVMLNIEECVRRVFGRLLECK